MYTLIHNSTKIPPLHVFVAETIHDISRSKRLVNMMNRISISYNEMLTIDNIAAKRIINETGENRVPVSETMRSSTTIQGAMDNFDHEENTLSGIKGSHDTILMLFQNNDEEEQLDINDQHYISIMPESASNNLNKKALDHILPCQLLSKASNRGKRGEIPESFVGVYSPD